MINLAMASFPELKTMKITDHEAEAVMLGLLNA
jgi:hypothetical protein